MSKEVKGLLDSQYDVSWMDVLHGSDDDDKYEVEAPKENVAQLQLMTNNCYRLHWGPDNSPIGLGTTWMNSGIVPGHGGNNCLFISIGLENFKIDVTTIRKHMVGYANRLLEAIDVASPTHDPTTGVTSASCALVWSLVGNVHGSDLPADGSPKEQMQQIISSTEKGLVSWEWFVAWLTEMQREGRLLEVVKEPMTIVVFHHRGSQISHAHQHSVFRMQQSSKVVLVQCNQRFTHYEGMLPVGLQRDFLQKIELVAPTQECAKKFEISCTENLFAFAKISEQLMDALSQVDRTQSIMENRMVSLERENVALKRRHIGQSLPETRKKLSPAQMFQQVLEMAEKKELPSNFQHLASILQTTGQIHDEEEFKNSWLDLCSEHDLPISLPAGAIFKMSMLETSSSSPRHPT